MKKLLVLNVVWLVVLSFGLSALFSENAFASYEYCKTTYDSFSNTYTTTCF